MRRRLLVLAVTLVGMVLVALTVPLITTFAEDRTQDLFVKRLGSVTRFAVVAEDVLETGDARSLDIDLERYVEVYGGSVVVLDANREVVAQAGAGTTGPAVEEAIHGALTGRPSPPLPTVWPWSAEPAVIASPVGRDAQVLGAVVLVAPTTSVADAVTTWLLFLGLAGVLVLLLTVFGVVAPFVGWVMRPVHDLDAAARRLALGDLGSRAHEIGPPELRELAASFNTMADNVETSQRQQRELVADAAHQLGNPLTALRLRVEHLRGRVDDPEQVRPAIEETDRLSALVGSLLDLSHVGSGSRATVAVDVVAEAAQRCTMWQPVFPALRLAWDDAPLARGTEGLVDLVLDTALDNAAKFAEGAPVEVAVAVQEGDVVLSVRDHGPGLPADEVAKVGARFFRGRTHQNVAGTGLGLAIVRARLHDVGGRLEVDAADGGGLVVAARLPAVTTRSPGSSHARRDAAPPAT